MQVATAGTMFIYEFTKCTINIRLQSIVEKTTIITE